MTIRTRSVPVVFVTLASFLGTHVLPVVALAAGAGDAPPPRSADLDERVPEQARKSAPPLAKLPAAEAPVTSTPRSADLTSIARGPSKAVVSPDVGSATRDPSLAPAAADASEPQKADALLTAGPEKSGASSKAISTPKGAGKIDGMGESFSAQLSTGIATYTVPLSLPDARGDVQPTLSLSYSSGDGLGIAGMGWGLGVASISRQSDHGLPKYDDRAAWHPEQDRFVFNGGQELVPLCTVGAAPALSCSVALSGELMPAWSAGWQYFRPRVEGSFLRFFWSPDHQTWRVQDKSGVTMELGVPLDGANDLTALERNPTKTSQIYAWHLARQYDAYGNSNPASGNPTPRNVIVYKYLQSGGRALLQDIYDTTPASNPTSYALASFAHHTHLRYDPRPDTTVSYRAGWAQQQTQRLAHVDVTSKTYADGSSGNRALVRRYHLGYDPAYHTSFLASVQYEGRCSGSERNAPQEDGNFLLQDVTSCGSLPPIKFSYSHATGSTALAGYEPFNTTIQSATTTAGAVAKSFGVSDLSVEFFDVNNDGLPDVVWSPPWKAFLNGAQGHAPAFGAGVDMLVNSPGVPAADAAVMNAIQLNNQNLAPLDFDGDGSIDLVHTPATNDVRVYSLAKGSSQLSWLGRKITGAQNFKVDFRSGTRATRVADVNFDGLVDVVVASGEQLQTFFALGRYIGGQGLFGSAVRTGALTTSFATTPATACLPWAGQTVDLDSGAIQFAEMNGDGIVDIVKLEAGKVRYWPGRGDGHWGNSSRELPSGCQSGIEDTGYVTMSASPFFSGFRPERMRLEDVNGDGLEDITQVDEDSVSVWLNVDGKGWTARARLAGMPSAALDLNRVRFADVNGSGTPDVFWGNGNAYQFIDLTGGVRTGLLTGVDNGLGKTTTLEYSSSTAEMLAAEQSSTACDVNQPWSSRWCSKMPTVAHVVKRVTESDNLSVAGKAASQVTEYSYRDPVFDGRQREFRGFRLARSRQVGDTTAPTDFSESAFLLGECEDETVGAFDNSIDDCADPGRDNPREALKGLPVVTSRYSETGIYLSTEANTYRLRHLYTGADGRAVRVAFGSSKRLISFDSAAGAASSTRMEAQTTVELERGYDAAKDPLKVASLLTNPITIPAAEVSKTLQFAVPAYANYAVLEQATFQDFFGNPFLQISKGCTSGNACPVAGPGSAPDEQLYGFSIPGMPSPQQTNWIWRTVQSFARGSVHSTVDRNKSAFAYTPEGAVKTVTLTLAGSGVLDRFHAGGKATAPTPSDAAVDGSYVSSQTDYDDYGNVLKETLPLGRCRRVSYDTLNNASGVGLGYAQVAVTETLFPKGCDVGSGLSTSATYDRGFASLDSEVDLALQRTAVSFDEFGRVVALRRPHADGTTVLDTDVPSVSIDYTLPSNSTTRYSIIHSRAQDGATEGAASYLETYAYVDGFGRTRVALTEADTSAGDGGNWVVTGFGTLSAKGSPATSYLPYFSSASPTAFPLSTVPTTTYREQAYDSFGRLYKAYDLDRTQTIEKRYHALSDDTYDAEDLSSSAHAGTYASARQDGHGRLIAATERIKVATVLEARDTRTTYLPTGEVESIVRTLPGQATPPTVVRWVRYDSLGRPILNVEPNTTLNYTAQINASGTPGSTGIKAWRYVYNNAGELVGTSDARGCGQNFFYDGMGRLIAEDFSPCENHHPLWVAPKLTPGAAGYGTDVDALYIYDNASTLPSGATPAGYTTTSANLLGRVAAIYDRGQSAFLTYDARGRITRGDKRLTVPGAFVADPSVRYTGDWFSRSFAFDAADRQVKAGTGAQRSTTPQSPLCASDGTSDVTTTYSLRGKVASVGGSYGTLVSNIKHAADDLPTSMQYGDVAHTAANYTYDARRRLFTASVDRAAPGFWSTPTSYTPAPAPSGAPSTFQLVLQNDQYTYDLVGNPMTVQDNRTPGEWPAGALPVTRSAQYDDLYRVSQLTYAYSTTDDTWVSPHAADIGTVSDTRRALPGPHVSFVKRVKSQTFQFDWLGNITQSGDDASGFYDRSLGTQTHDTTAVYQLKTATGVSTSARNGSIATTFAPGGYMSSLQVNRSGPCLPSSSRCNQRFDYQWDEVGRLQTATRNDVVSQTDALGAAEAKLTYQYDSSDARVLKTSVDSMGRERHTVYAFDTFELRGATFDTSTKKYLRDATTEVAYLEAREIHLARLAYNPVADNVPRVNNALVHVFFELTDALHSNSVIFDKDTSELVERETYFGFGATESDYRPDRWKGFREDDQFTGKEEDIEVGIRYFGRRYYSSYLNRWISPDPLAVHAPGSADLNLYAYVSGEVLRLTDLFGLEGAAPTPVPFGPKDAAPGTKFVFGGGADRMVPLGDFQKTATGKQVFIYDPNANLPSSIKASNLSAEAFTQAVKNIMGQAAGNCSGPACGTAKPGQKTTGENTNAADAVAMVGGMVEGQGPVEGGKAKGSPGGGCATCQGSNLQQATIGSARVAGVVAPEIAEGAAALKAAAKAIPSSRALGRALEAAGHLRPNSSAAHHIVAGRAKAAAPARAVLKKFGIAINEAENGVFLAQKVHQKLHTNAYYREVNEALSAATSKGEAIEILKDLASGLRLKK